MGTPKEVERIADDPDALAEFLRGRNVRIVGFDGCSGAGKSNLANSIRMILGGIVIDLDDYLRRKQGRFVDALRIDDLKASVCEAKSKEEPVLISGVCLTRVLSRIGVQPDMIIYVEKLSPAGVPCDLNILDCETRGNISPLENELYSDFDREVGRYHSELKPRSRADLIFMRTERV
jgi:hypothetical protein